MKNLELKDICGNIPHNLMMLSLRTTNGYIENKTYLVVGERIDHIIYYDYLKPILRPISDICKTIIHNGKEIIPIVECAKIFDSVYSPVNVGIGDKVYGVQYKNEEGELYSLCYHEETYSFGCHNQKNKLFGIVHYQTELFDYLNELKIDCRGLIDAGLAVSVYDLEVNPYK
jgi:hypothetical protein